MFGMSVWLMTTVWQHVKSENASGCFLFNLLINLAYFIPLKKNGQDQQIYAY